MRSKKEIERSKAESKEKKIKAEKEASYEATLAIYEAEKEAASKETESIYKAVHELLELVRSEKSYNDYTKAIARVTRMLENEQKEKPMTKAQEFMKKHSDMRNEGSHGFIAHFTVGHERFCEPVLKVGPAQYEMPDITLNDFNQYENTFTTNRDDVNSEYILKNLQEKGYRVSVVEKSRDVYQALASRARIGVARQTSIASIT